jgi:hypothetical protein
MTDQPKAAHVFNPVTLWPTQDLISLADLKTLLRIDPTDTSKDDELDLIIDGVSATIAMMANRSFGYDEVQETIYNNVDEDRIYFSQWPVKLADIQTLTLNGVDILSGIGTDWVLEENKGFMFRPQTPWNGTVFAHYTGGYKLPDETPADLVRAASAAMREDYYVFVRGAVLSGVRMIAHKHARVQYYPPGQVGATVSGSLGPAGTSATWNAVWATVYKYVRWWV